MYRLVDLTLNQPVAVNVAGFLARRSVGNPAEWSAPAGYAYMPEVVAEAPEHDPETQRLIALPDLVSDQQVVTGRYEVEDVPSEELLANAKSAKFAAIEAWNAAFESAGWDSGLGWSLSTTVAGRRNFADQLFVKQIQGTDDAANVPFFDASGTVRTLPYAEYRAMLVSYATATESQLMAYLGLQAAVAAAQTLEQLAAIEIPE